MDVPLSSLVITPFGTFEYFNYPNFWLTSNRWRMHLKPAGLINRSRRANYEPTGQGSYARSMTDANYFMDSPYTIHFFFPAML